MKRIGKVICIAVLLIVGAIITGYLTGCIDPDEALPHYGIHSSEAPH